MTGIEQHYRPQEEQRQSVCLAWRVRGGEANRGVQGRMKKEELGSENIGHSFNKF